jgi:hypothetical protein
VGQAIVIENTEAVDGSMVVTMNRSLTSQVGEGYDSQADANAGDSFGALLARRIFEVDESIDRIYIASNSVVLKRAGIWDDESVSSVSRAIEDLFLFYPAV